jgi:uncharacterized coiled-coil DUF342 family protein
MSLNNFIYTKQTEQTEEQIENLPDFIKKALFPSKEPAPINTQIKDLEEQIASTDYQVIKCYEYSLAGLELPYDIQELHNSREAIREQIRKLEAQL